MNGGHISSGNRSLHLWCLSAVVAGLLTLAAKSEESPVMTALSSTTLSGHVDVSIRIVVPAPVGPGVATVSLGAISPPHVRSYPVAGLDLIATGQVPSLEFGITHESSSLTTVALELPHYGQSGRWRLQIPGVGTPLPPGEITALLTSGSLLGFTSVESTRQSLNDAFRLPPPGTPLSPLASVTVVPEPATLTLLALGAGFFVLEARRRRISK